MFRRRRGIDGDIVDTELEPELERELDPEDLWDRISALSASSHVSRASGTGLVAVEISTPPFRSRTERTIGVDMFTIDSSIAMLMSVAGAVGAVIVDGETGMTLASAGAESGSVEAAAAIHIQAVRTSLTELKASGMDDAIEDVLITFGKTYHISRPVELASGHTLVMYFVISRAAGNLALSRLKVAEATRSLSI